MKLGPRRAIRCVVGTVIAGLLGIGLAYGQAGQAGAGQKPQMSEEAFKNIQVLRGIPVKEFMETMGFFASSLSLNCTDCHGEASASDWANYAIDTPMKQTARRMVVMMNAINKADFGGARMVTCYTCHRNSERPKVIPSLAAQYAVPIADDPDEVEVIAGVRQTSTVDQILNKYIQAVGGAQALAKLTSFTAKGTYSGFDSDFSKVSVDVFAKSPDQRATVVHQANADATSTYDGHEAWLASPLTLAPVPLMPLVGEDLEGARLDAMLSFPGQIKQTLSNWHVGFPATTVDDHPVDVIEGATPSGALIKLYFDKQSGLLVRQVRYTHTAIGVVPTHVEYSDYRLVAGVKVPFKWTVTWVDGQSTFEMTQVTPNAPVDAAKFAKPGPPVTKAPAR